MVVGLKDIALRAGVSLATVSNVVNGYRPVGEATRVRVQQAIDELGYVPNLSARHLRRGRTGIIGLAIPELDNPYFAELAGYAIREARSLGYTLLLEYTDSDRATELTLAEGNRSQIIDGLILSPVQLTRADVLARRSTTPLVLIGENVAEVPHDHIAIDNVAASHVAVQHLVSLGRRRIAFLGAHADAVRQPSRLRQRGYQEALATAGLPVEETLIGTASRFGRADGLTAMRAMLARTEPPDAVFAYNDLIALGAMRAVTEAGLRIPEDVAVIGFDDIEEGRFSNPTLTTIAPDKERIGRVAVRSLIARVEGKAAEPGEVQPSFRLVTRESTLGRFTPAAPTR
ncbi:MAG TPA: LacI family DNA-binding transcriptional regulator [Phytomonospora sp.]